jgi:colanic acid/amylovoran biosynthesis glycosyltransferase
MTLSKKWIVIVALFSGNLMGEIEQRPLNILFVVDYFPSLSQIYIVNMITGLIDQGHNVSIFSFRHNKSLSVLPKVQEYNLLNHVTYQEFPEQLPDCDIVFCQFGDLGQRILAMENLSQWLQERKLVVCLRGFDVMGYFNNPSDVNDELFNKVDLFLPVCDHFKKRLSALGCNPDKIVVHHSAIDCSQFFFKIRTKPYNDRINLISVGRFVKKKGMSYAIRAIAQIVQKYPRIHFTLIGDGPERNNLQLLIKKLNLQDTVTLEGWMSQQEIVYLLNRSHIFLLPSITPPNGNEEGIANALKEAMAMGLISIATWHAGTPELIDDGISGFLVPEKKSKELANTIEYVIEHPELWRSIGLSARKKIEDEFEIEKLACQLEELFYQLLEPV